MRGRRYRAGEIPGVLCCPQRVFNQRSLRTWLACTMLRSVITGELRSKIDRLWDAFWSGGISNPLEVIEQITYLMFIRRLDGIQTTKEHKANRTGQPIENPIYTAGDQPAALVAVQRTAA